MPAMSPPFPTLPASDIGRASKFYETVLDFRPVEDPPVPGGVLYDVGGGNVWVYETPNAGTAQNTAAAWFVEDIDAEVKRLQGAGVSFETFDAPDVQWDGVIASNDRLRSAWFRDTEGNILCIDQEL
jgi:catechol 2,3-dioxygenase-like lactoylglutathione lyase family enzyme